MTLYSAATNSRGVVSDLFVVDGKEKGYHFSGTTLTPQGNYIPNDLRQYKYYAFGNNKGISVEPTKIAFLVEGQETIVVRGDFQDIFDRLYYHTEERIMALRPSGSSSYKLPWLHITNRLDDLAKNSREAQSLCAIMREWEQESVSTLAKAKNTMQKVYPHAHGGEIEIYVAGQQWLGYNWQKNLFTAGYGDELWGEVSVRPDVTGSPLELVSPVSNGWFVIQGYLGKSLPERYLLHQTDRGIQARPVLFPADEWTRIGEWTVWYRDSMVLTPIGNLLTVPAEFEIIDASEQWAFLLSISRPYLMILIDLQGKWSPVRFKFNNRPRIYAGNKTVLVAYRRSGNVFFSFMDVTGWPVFQNLWTTKAFPNYTTYRVYVIRGNPDTFVIVFTMGASKTQNVCCVDAWGRACLIPVAISAVDSPLTSDTHLTKQADRHGVIELLDQSNQSEIKSLSIWASKGMVHAYIDKEITWVGHMVRLPNQPEALWNYLRSYLLSS